MARRKSLIEEPVTEVVAEEVTVEHVEEPVAEKPEIKGTIKKATKKKNTVKITSPAVNVRKDPSLSGEILDVVTQNEKFDLIDSDEAGFYKIAFNGGHAFVSKDFSTLA